MVSTTSLEVWIDYTNWKGNRRIRLVRPLDIVFAQTMYHKQKQWLLKAVDLEDEGKTKYFAMQDIHSWKARSNDKLLGTGDGGSSSE